MFEPTFKNTDAILKDAGCRSDYVEQTSGL